MRILHVLPAPFPLPLGSQVYAGGLCGALAARGHEVTLACYATGEGALPDAVRVVRARSLGRWSVHGSGPDRARPLNDLALADAVRRHTRRHPPDVVHAHNVEGPVVARLAGVRGPLVYARHTRMADELPQWWPGRPGVAAFGRALDVVAERLCDVTTALSDAGADGRCVVAPPGVDADTLPVGDVARAQQRWGLSEAGYVLYAGNLDNYQDLDRLAIVGGTAGAPMLVATSADADAARALAATLPDARVVRVVDLTDLADAHALAAVVVSPRRRCAGFPMKVLNALAFGVPTVCSPGCAPPIPGVVRADGDSDDDLARAVAALVADPLRRARLARDARDAVRGAWSWDAAAARVEAVYRRLLGRAG